MNVERLIAVKITSSGLDVLANGNVLVASMLPCVSLMKPDGGEIWSVHAPTLDLNNQADKLRVSADGEVVDFGDERYASAFRFDTRLLKLSSSPSDDSSTFPPKRDGLAVAEWRDTRSTRFANVPIPLTNLDISRSLAIEPDNKGFYLGSSQLLRAFDSRGGKRWSRAAAYGEAWAVNATRDGRLLVVAYGDGTIRWHRADDGAELLALQVLRKKGDVSQWDWVLWTPEGFYEATPGARDALRWVVNNGIDQTPTTLAVSAIPRLHRPKALRLILETLDTALALGRDDIAAARLDVRTRTHSAKAPGPVLHVLTIGVDKYGQAAGDLHLDYAVNDARDVMDALFKSQTVAESLYADVEPEEPLVDEKAGRVQIMDALDRIADSMHRHQPIQDVAVIFVSTHGEIIGDPGPPDHSEFYLAPYGFDIASANASASSALPLTAFADKISKLADYGKVLLLLDACHSGAAGPGGWMRNPNAERLRTAMVNQNVAVLTSSSESELSNELPEYGHGALAQAFLDALSAPVYRNGVVSLSALADKMDEEVESLTKNLKNQQHLGRNLNFNKKLFLVSGNAAAPTP